jgi:thioredoxin reductase (NADPH)
MFGADWCLVVSRQTFFLQDNQINFEFIDVESTEIRVSL